MLSTRPVRSHRLCYNLHVDDVIITIPAYEPDEALTTLVRRLLKSFRSVVVIDDGSVRSRLPFDELRRENGVIVLQHPENKGKGAALKTAFREIIRRFPNAAGTVTVDADGQHLPEDVLKVATSMISHPDTLTIGVRTFDKDIPFRSRLGNLWTCGEFLLLTGVYVRDTQTGLRGIPKSLLRPFLDLPGERYEYEIAMLVNAVRTFGPVEQVPVSTVYSPGNPTSHYRPLADTWKTQRTLFSAAFRRLISPQRRTPDACPCTTRT